VRDWLRGDLTALALFNPFGQTTGQNSVRIVKDGKVTEQPIEPYMVTKGHQFANDILDYLAAHPTLDSYWGVSIAEFVAWGFERAKALETSDPTEAANIRGKSQKLWDEADKYLKSLDPNKMGDKGIQWGNAKTSEPTFMDIYQWKCRGWEWNPTSKSWDFKGLKLQWDMDPNLWKVGTGNTTPKITNPTTTSTTSPYIGTSKDESKDPDPLTTPKGDSYSKTVDDATAAFQGSLAQAKEVVASALQDPINREITNLLNQGAYTSAEIKIREALEKNLPLDMLVNVRMAVRGFTLLVSAKSAPARGAGNELHRKLGDNFYAISRRALRVQESRLAPMSMVGSIQVPAPIGLDIDLLWPIGMVVCFMVLLISVASSWGSSGRRRVPKTRSNRAHIESPLSLTKMTRDYFGISVLVFSFVAYLLTLTYIDVIIHKTLYQYGLLFDYAWANPYWNNLWLLTVTYSITVFAAYVVNRPKTKSCLVKGFLYFCTFYLLFVNLDLLWFAYAGYLPPLDYVWWWLPQKWTTLQQIVFTATLDLSIVSFWVAYTKWCGHIR
jgi:hypothetical protein